MGASKLGQRHARAQNHVDAPEGAPTERQGRRIPYRA